VADSYLFRAKEAGESAKDIAAALERRLNKPVSPKTVDSKYFKLRQRLPSEVRP
jgi:hypothetical protein